MGDNVSPDKNQHNRSESRITADQYESVEFRSRISNTLHKFKLIDISLKGLCFVAKENSEVFNDLKTGDTLKMKYFPAVSTGGAVYLITKIMHITKARHKEFKGHKYVGLLTLEKEEGSVMMK